MALASGLRNLCEKFWVKIVESSSLFFISYANKMFVTSLMYIKVSSLSDRWTLRFIIDFPSYPILRQTWLFGLSAANYSASKRVSMAYCSSFFANTQLKVSSLRPYAIG